MVFRILPLLVMFLVSTACSNAVSRANNGAKPGTGFVTHKLANDRKYGVFIPHNYSPNKYYPTILFLHGGFENGSDPDKAFNVGIGPVVADRAETFEYIVIFPQARSSWRGGPEETNDAYAALQDVRKKYRVDDARVTLTGLSWGGYGVWALAQEHPTEFCALIPMCGNEKPDAVPTIKNIPTWCFHNNMDPFVSVGDSKNMVNLINEAGGRAKITTYTAFGHDVWVRAYKEEELWAWIGKQHKAGTVAPAARRVGPRTPVSKSAASGGVAPVARSVQAPVAQPVESKSKPGLSRSQLLNASIPW